MAVDRIYPESLPQYAEISNYSQTIGRSNSIVSEMDDGPAKVRRRSLAASRPYTLSIVLTIPQIDILEEWFDDTLKGGVLSFEWVHPIKRTPAFFRFKDPSERPQVTPWNNAGQLFQLTMNLELLP